MTTAVPAATAPTYLDAESGVLSAVGCVLYLCWYNPILYPVSVTLTST